MSCLELGGDVKIESSKPSPIFTTALYIKAVSSFASCNFAVLKVSSVQNSNLDAILLQTTVFFLLRGISFELRPSSKML